MDVVIRKSDVGDFTFFAPPSKSYTHRAYAIASLADGASEILNPLRAGDTDSTLRACAAFGAEIEESSGKVIIAGTGGALNTPSGEIDVGNSGTTIRLFTSIAALNGSVVLTGDESVQRRPMQPLLEALAGLGVSARSMSGDGTPPIMVRGGGIGGGTTRIRGDISSQFISSLLIASPYAKEPVTIELTTPLKSRPYVDVTLDIMGSFGVDLENNGYEEFRVAKSGYKPREYRVEGDYSSASYFFALAALHRATARVENLLKNSIQGDRILLDILKKMGASVRVKDRAVVVEGGSLEGIEVDLSDTPDLLPTVAALACAAKGRTVIKNIGHARLKESDRVSASAREFAKFGAHIKEDKDSLEISGASALKGAKVNSHGDHRMVMALAILGSASIGDTVIDHARSADISFPGFFEALRRAGVEAELI